MNLALPTLRQQRTNVVRGLGLLFRSSRRLGRKTPCSSLPNGRAHRSAPGRIMPTEFGPGTFENCNAFEAATGAADGMGEGRIPAPSEMATLESARTGGLW